MQNRDYKRVKNDIIPFLKQDVNAYCTTMFDYYGLLRNFRGVPVEGNLTTIEKADIVEQALHKDIISYFGDKFFPNHFRPYIQMHEHETLPFSDPHAFTIGIYRQDLAKNFEYIRKAFPTSEDINDESNTMPSKRIKKLCKNYNKPLNGTLAAIVIGIETIREECKHFNQWVKKLEALCIT